MSLLALAARVLDSVHKGGRHGCLVGGLAVSARSDPRFTRDVDLAVAVDGDADGEALIRALASCAAECASAENEPECLAKVGLGIGIPWAANSSLDVEICNSQVQSDLYLKNSTLKTIPCPCVVSERACAVARSGR